MKQLGKWVFNEDADVLSIHQSCFSIFNARLQSRIRRVLQLLTKIFKWVDSKCNYFKFVTPKFSFLNVQSQVLASQKVRFAMDNNKRVSLRHSDCSVIHFDCNYFRSQYLQSHLNDCCQVIRKLFSLMIPAPNSTVKIFSNELSTSKACAVIFDQKPQAQHRWPRGVCCV